METLTARLNITLHKNQKTIHASPARFKVVKAGKQFGKTRWMLFELTQSCLSKPNSLIWYIAPSYRQAESIAWRHLQWMIPEHLIKKSIATLLRIEFINGSVLELKGADNEDSLRGIGLNGVGYDEYAMFKNQYLHEGIIASQLIAKKGFAYWISTPNRTGRNFFSQLYDDAVGRMRNGDKEWAAFYYTIYDNPTLDIEEIERAKDRTTDQTWQLEYLAIESEFAGQKFAEFGLDRNTGEYKEDKALPIYRALDWGLDHPSVCLWAKLDSDFKKIYVYDEFVKRGEIIQGICQTVKEKTGSAPIEWTVIDPSSSRRDPATGRSIIDEYARYGIGCVSGDRRERGYDITKMFLKKGMLIISSKCKNLILELQNLQWGDKDGDDCTDALRYLCVKIHDTINGMNITEAVDEYTGLTQKEKYEKINKTFYNIHTIEGLKEGNSTTYFEEVCR